MSAVPFDGEIFAIFSFRFLLPLILCPLFLSSLAFVLIIRWQIKRKYMRNRSERRFCVCECVWVRTPSFIIFINCRWGKSVNQATNNDTIEPMRQRKKRFVDQTNALPSHTYIDTYTYRGLATTSKQIWSNVPMGRTVIAFYKIFFRSFGVLSAVVATVKLVCWLKRHHSN